MVVVVSPLGTGLGIASSPHTTVHRIHSDAPTIEGVKGQERAKGWKVYSPAREGRVPAIPAPAVCGLEAKVHGRGLRSRGEYGIGEFEERVGAPAKARVEGGAEGAQGGEGIAGSIHSGHILPPLTTP